MIVGVDADGVLTDMTAFNIEYGRRYFKKNPVNPNGYNASQIFGVSSKMEFWFGFRYFITYCKKWLPREGAAEINRRLNADGHRLYEITARKFVTMHNPIGWYSRKMFTDWLKKHGFYFEDIYYCSESNSPHDKLDGCRKVSADVMIDDKSDVALKLAENGIKVLLFDAPYNQEVEHENILRVFSWEQVYREINSLKENAKQ